MSQSEVRPLQHTQPGEASVRGFVHSPAAHRGHGLVLTHGAGANCHSPLLIALANEFCAFGLTVIRCDLPFRQLRPHGPPPRGSAERDQQGLRAVVAELRSLIDGRVFLGGHSYGGRQASMLAAAEPGLVDGLLLLSYPLHPPRRAAEVRTAHFPNLHTPALFVQGSRDGFASPGEITDALKIIPARTQLLSIEAAGHELMTKLNRRELPTVVIETFAAFFGLTHQA